MNKKTILLLSLIAFAITIQFSSALAFFYPSSSSCSNCDKLIVNYNIPQYNANVPEIIFHQNSVNYGCPSCSKINQNFNVPNRVNQAEARYTQKEVVSSCPFRYFNSGVIY